LPRIHQKEPESLTIAEAQALLNAPDKRTLKGKRDYALLHVMLSTGVRLGETIQSRVSDLVVKYCKPALNIMGKGKKPRIVRLLAEVKEAVAEYLTARKNVSNEDYLFLTVPRKGEPAHSLSPRGVQKLIQEYATRALIQKRVTPHTLRHTAATLELEGGANLMEIKNQLGHSSISMTQRYLHTKGEPAEKHPLYNGGQW
jgi:site-specific recombinase XerD